MDRTQRDAIERLLLREREKIQRSIGRFQQNTAQSRDAADADLSSYSFHMADQGTDAMEREKSFLFASKEGRYLYRLEEALRRLYTDPEGFGICHGCKNEIPFMRLEALPHARYCLDCKRREEEDKAA
ncbi:TraR/DksA family transcriptional regulator [Longimicrobium terrae]|uniref:RNA polymerase-binding transcription factor DksA n=1 Tax=Longimicrobium terrae TaxID=1639882 RepID=A0A841GW38_9BACT|nr:TraR/DksA C4-type zinc finger protein [Longimicrobium terrae]MBB4635754.1 RNA polymerase-binding transcription factor DksA [Longimicrobium terrae]MBB6070148.1 RNA polymerase-binding transcription factor DksA [Longimicrobium terrae]NNC33049.1 TraR/DksA family transcriptional regulator [Longimicrobium terrae]